MLPITVVNCVEFVWFDQERNDGIGRGRKGDSDSFDTRPTVLRKSEPSIKWPEETIKERVNAEHTDFDSVLGPSEYDNVLGNKRVWNAVKKKKLFQRANVIGVEGHPNRLRSTTAANAAIFTRTNNNNVRFAM